MSGDRDGVAGRDAALGSVYARWNGQVVPAASAGRTSRGRCECRLWPRSRARQRSNGALRQVLERRRGHAYAHGVVDASTGDRGLERLRHCGDDLWHVVLALKPLPRVSVTGNDLLDHLHRIPQSADAIGLDFDDIAIT